MYLDRLRLDGRTAFVTGGAQGIGYACADALAEAGARVILADRDAAAIDAAIDSLRRKHPGIDGVVLDVTDSQAVTRVADTSGSIDILVNNAGIARSETAAEDVADEHWLNVLDVNLNGTFWCARAFGRHMLAAGKGSIVNIGSMSGFIVNRPQPQSYYNASKAAVHQLTKSLAAEWAPRGVRVNAVAPTYIATPLNAFADTAGEMYRRLIDERWHEKLTLDSISRACGLNRAKLTRGFRSMFAMSVADAIADRRLGGARDLLLATDLPVSSIGYRCGYLNNASFTRAFSRRYGQAPTQFRNRQLAA